jgi:hypothetical protein
MIAANQEHLNQQIHIKKKSKGKTFNGKCTMGSLFVKDQMRGDVGTLMKNYRIYVFT